MAPGATLCISGLDADKAVYIWQGTVKAPGVQLTPRSSAIVEYGAALSLTAGGEGATFLVYNVNHRGGKKRPGGHVHLLPNERVPRSKAGPRGVLLSLHADSQCPTCQLWLHEVDHFNADEETDLHHHSQAEVLFVRAGSIRIGNKIHGPGTALFVDANTKYAFSAGPDGLSFVNFRGAASTYTKADGSPEIQELTIWHSRLKSPEYMAPSAG
jgi:hypothetical protein